MQKCDECGQEMVRGLTMHVKSKHGGGVAVAEKPSEAVPFRPRSRRGRQQYEGDILKPIDQIRTNSQIRPDADSTGAWAYYIRPDGATIMDALIFQPNGGVPEIDDVKLRSKIGTNAEYYRARAARKGFEYVGPVLNEQGIRRLVEVLGANRADECLFCEDEIANCEHVLENADRPEVRDQARRRRSQFQRRLDTLRQPFDADALLSELNEVAQAQMLARVDPNVMRVMRMLIGETNERLANMAQSLRGKGMGQGYSKPSVPDSFLETQGADFVDVN